MLLLFFLWQKTLDNFNFYPDDTIYQIVEFISFVKFLG